MHSNSAFTLLDPRLITLLPTLRQLAMDIKQLSFFGLYLDSLSRTIPEVGSKQGSESLACAAIRKPRGKQAVRSSCLFGKGVSTGL
jgi:hypothetical protein